MSGSALERKFKAEHATNLAPQAQLESRQVVIPKAEAKVNAGPSLPALHEQLGQPLSGDRESPTELVQAREPIEDLGKMLLDQEESTREPAGEICKLEDRIRELEKEVRLLQHNNLQLSKERGSLSKTVIEALANLKSAKEEKELNKYLVWRPSSYNSRLTI